MRRRIQAAWLAKALALWASALVFAAAAQEVRPLKDILMVCSGCHFPEPGTLAPSEAQRIPRLRGQQSEYLREALRQYRTRQRDHFYMRGMALGLKGEELELMLSHLSAPVKPEANTRPSAVAQPPAAALACIACHGTATQPPAAADIPRLAGQHAPYIEQAFAAYAEGRRKNPVMAVQARAEDGSPRLDAEQLKQVAAWFAAQPGLAAR